MGKVIVKTNCKSCFCSCKIIIEIENDKLVRAYKDPDDFPEGEELCEMGTESLDLLVKTIVDNDYKLTYGEILFSSSKKAVCDSNY